LTKNIKRNNLVLEKKYNEEYLERLKRFKQDLKKKVKEDLK
jgi:hypothetical protein